MSIRPGQTILPAASTISAPSGALRSLPIFAMLPSVDEHVGDGVEAVGRIDDAAALDEEAHAAFPPASR